MTKMIRTVSQKMNIKENSRALFINAEKTVLDNINLPTLNIPTKLEEDLDYIHLFVKTQAEFIDFFPKLKSHLKLNGMLWVSWPKGGKLGTDLNIKTVIKLGYDFGLVESTCLSINEIWSGLKFTHPKKGKIYNNSYGQLNEEKTTNKQNMKEKKQEIVDGVTIKYHANGKTIWSKGRIIDGKAEGYWEWYRIDGTIKRSGHFENGEPCDEWTTYDDKGKPYKVTNK